MRSSLCRCNERRTYLRHGEISTWHSHRRRRSMASLNASNPWEGHTVSDIMSDAGSQEDDEEDAEFTYPGASGDYSTQMEELFEGEDLESGDAAERSDDDDFLYDGIDANTSVSYKDQLREVLGQEDEDGKRDDDSSVHENGIVSHEDDETLVCVPSYGPRFTNFLSLTAFKFKPRRISICLVEGIIN